MDRRLASALPEEVLSVLAARDVGIRGVKNIANAALNAPNDYRRKSSAPTKSQIAFAKLVLNSADPLIRKCLRHGLPRGVHGRLYRPVRCRSCGGRMSHGPCVLCSRGRWAEDEIPATKWNSGEYSVPVESTRATPGSTDKVQIMRDRLLRGESAFHNDDKRYRCPPTRVETMVVSTEFLPQSEIDLLYSR